MLLEYELNRYGKVLEDLAQRPSCKLVPFDRHQPIDWPGIFAEHLPEQKPPTDDANRFYSRNDSLLLLDNLTAVDSKVGHFTPARRWAGFMEDCLRQTEMHSYGMIRILALLPAKEGEMVLPRTVHGRKRAAILTEAAGKAFDVAASPETGLAWYAYKEWDIIRNNAARVAERTAEQNVTVPEGRERPPIPLAPEAAEQDRFKTPYVPRPIIPFMQKYIEAVENVKQVEADKESTKNAINAARKNLTRQTIVLNQDNRRSHVRRELRERQMAIDELEVSLCRAAADPKVDIKTLKEMDAKLAAARAEYDRLYSESDESIAEKSDTYIDDRRAALRTGSFDDAVLHWDRRPFEPLTIEDDELYPREVPCNMIYFEPDPDSSLVQALDKMDQRQRSDTIGLFDEVAGAYGNRGGTSVAALLEAMFPGRSTDDIVKAVPSLAAVASRRLKPDFEGHHCPARAETPNGSGSESTTSTATSIDPKVGTDPAFSYQETIEYDFSRVRVRSLPLSVMWDLIAEYDRSPFKAKSAVQMNWALGGSMTEYKLASDMFEFKAGRAAGSIRRL